MADYSRLPGPNADLWDWQLRGLCRGKDSSLFFHPEGERGAARAAREQSAKEICLNCPVQKQCCEHALRVREPYGVWGGMTEEERESHYQRQKALVRARAVREKAALAEKAKLKEKLLRDHERELARRTGPSTALPEPVAEPVLEPAPAVAGVVAAEPTAPTIPALPVAPPKMLPTVAKPVGPRKRAGSAKPGGPNPAPTKKRTPANV
nr:WhiB family transcriptional regulator [Actinospica robiniae]